MACSAFYERGFGAPPQRFLCSLLQFYGLELHHLTPSLILHIVAFIPLCEAYMGIEPHFDLWNYFFRVRLLSVPDAEAAMLGCVDLCVRSGQGVDLYYRLSVSNLPVGWRRVWFFLQNNTTRPLLEVTGRRPAAQPYWRYGVVKKDLRKLQPMLDILKSLI
jgi:hypothetical protein